MYFAPSQFEAGFISTAHTAEDMAKTSEVAARALEALRANGAVPYNRIAGLIRSSAQSMNARPRVVRPVWMRAMPDNPARR